MLCELWEALYLKSNKISSSATPSLELSGQSLGPSSPN